jgi:hypothetical protein
MDGVLSLLCLVSRGRVVALVAGGLAVLAVDLGVRREAVWAGLRARAAQAPSHTGLLVGLGALTLLALVQAAGSGLEQAAYWRCDDGASYLVFPAQMLSAGCAVQPFSIRGLNGYGGQGFLNALVMAELPTS